MKFVILALALTALTSLVSAIYPFDDNCSCEDFCDYKCAVNATEPTNITLYRMTMKGVLDLTNKDTGDVAGDASFVLSRRTTAYECQKDPTNFQCSLATFTGDDANSTDLVLEMNIEVDGQWGPYLLCNPVNASEPTGPWFCVTHLKTTVPDYPEQCLAENIEGMSGLCLNIEPQVVQQSTLAECCQAIPDSFRHPLHFVNMYNYNTTSGECKLFQATVPEYYSCDSIYGYYMPPNYYCECPRVNQAIGKEDLEIIFQGKDLTFDPVGGVWQSFPAEGECQPGQTIGEVGCAWRLNSISRAINASCMYETYDKAIQELNPLCFNNCEKPFNVTSECYLACYNEAVQSATQAQLIAPWEVAFSTCPKLDLNAVEKFFEEHEDFIEKSLKAYLQ